MLTNKTFPYSFLLFLSALLIACSDKKPEAEQPDSGMARRTVLVYMCAENSLGAWHCHTTDSAEIMDGHAFISPADRLLMFIDDDKKPRLYSVTAGREEPLLLKQWDYDICSASPKRFAEVLEIMKEKCPAQEYGLVMWSHADGWIPATETDYDAFENPAVSSLTPHTLSFGIDSGPDGKLGDKGANMNVADMAQAIDAAGIHCRFIFFDACLMQNLEVAYALRNQTDYIVASPMAIPSAGAYYTHQMEKGLFSADPADIARTYLQDVTDTDLRYIYGDYGLAIACLQTDKLAHLAATLKNALPASSLADGQTADMNGVLNYQTYCSRYYYRPHNYDARQSIARILAPADTAQALRALDDVIVYHGATERYWIGPYNWDYQHVPIDTDNYRAVSMFVPQEVYTRNAKSTIHGDLNTAFRQTEWYSDAGFEFTGW